MMLLGTDEDNMLVLTFISLRLLWVQLGARVNIFRHSIVCVFPICRTSKSLIRT
ncbi:hypothetical protein SERLA73DRAFT_146635, partial [Serpula lacrymans var. lacrymans S7.3]